MSDYCTPDDIDNRYGNPNVVAWADMEGYGAGNAMIYTRVAGTIATVTERMNDRLRASDFGFVLPVMNSAGTTPLTLVEIAVKLCGYELSTARGVKAYDKDGNPLTPLANDRKDALDDLEEVVSGKLKLDVYK